MKLIIEIEEQLENTREQMCEYEAHLEALENGETFVPKRKSSDNGKKRKNTGKSKQGSPKRRRSVVSDSDDYDELMESDEDISDNSDGDEDDDDENTKSLGEEPDSSEVEDQDEDIPELTEDDLMEKIQEAKDAIKSSRVILSNARTAKKEAIDALSSVEKGSVKIQREKNAFCSLKRSEVSGNLLVNNILTD
jgi:hypothetical protein